MGRTLHAFKSYNIKIDLGGFYEIHYEDDEDYEIALGNWHYIYTVLQYAEHLIGTEISIPAYHWLEDADKVNNKGMILTDSSLFVKGLESVISNIKKIKENDNPLIDGDNWYLFDIDNTCRGTLEKQKNELIGYAKILLEWAKKGLHFVEER
jgi:hypothetical protein